MSQTYGMIRTIKNWRYKTCPINSSVPLSSASPAVPLPSSTPVRTASSERRWMLPEITSVYGAAHGITGILGDTLYDLGPGGCP